VTRRHVKLVVKNEMTPTSFDPW